MTGNEAARVFYAEPAFGHRFGKIAELLDDRKPGANHHERQDRRDVEPSRGNPSGECRASDPSGQSGPGLLRTQSGGETRAAKTSPDGIGADVGRPDNGEHPQQCGPPGWFIAREPE